MSSFERSSSRSNDYDGSDVEHNARYEGTKDQDSKDLESRREKAEEEAAWEPVRKVDKEQTLIWRLKDMKVKPVEAQDYGIFFNDVIYVVLKVANKQRKICYDLHFWIPYRLIKEIGPEPPQKVMELSALLNDQVVYHKEIEYFESSILKNYFKTFIVLHGGPETAFDEKEPKKYKPRLLKFKLNRNRGELREVPLSKKALQSHYVFVLDKGLCMLQWNGSFCSEKDRSGASPHIENFLKRRKGKLTREFYDEEDLLGINPFTSVLSDDSVDPMPTPPQYIDKAMYRLSDDDGKLKLIPVYHGRISRSGLDPADVNFIDTLDGLYIYIGPTASKREREGVWRGAEEYLNSTVCPTRSIHCLNAGEKSFEFNEIWDDYN
ncbi:Severin [Echinococcus granulosus]|uniref:Gelsolin n=1 Tax=Echinococcus granulosus TaxID=6210 RepID=A0A068W9R8_ECHGR|nr:Severin [Echinococcus granulosus]CDS16400.1 gelsolin [Echinococcus granulosus]